MSETDALSLAQSLWANAISVYVIFLSVLSGYIVIAYFMGKSLSGGQVAIVNFLFAGIAGPTLYIWQSFASTALYYSGLAANARGEHFYSFDYGMALGLAFNSALVIAAIVFMWLVRHRQVN